MLVPAAALLSLLAAASTDALALMTRPAHAVTGRSRRPARAALAMRDPRSVERERRRAQAAKKSAGAAPSPSSSPDAASPAAPAEPAPRRILSETGSMNMRTQLKLVRALAAKTDTAAQGYSRPTKAFRRDRSGGPAVPKEPPSKARSRPPTLLVDGYNIANKWAKLKKRLVAGDLGVARSRLADELACVASQKGWHVELVWDAAESDLAGPSAAVTTDGALSIVYTSQSESADEYIEKQTRFLCDEDECEVYVGSDDGIIRTQAAAAGAQPISAAKVIATCKSSKASSEYVESGRWLLLLLPSATSASNTSPHHLPGTSAASSPSASGTTSARAARTPRSPLTSRN